MVPNPSFDIEKDSPEDSHRQAVEGDIVDLTDVQYLSFKDKFSPIEEESLKVRDDDAALLASAKAIAAKTGQTTDPNKKAASV